MTLAGWIPPLSAANEGTGLLQRKTVRLHVVGVQADEHVEFARLRPHFRLAL